jgi:hypothetical protein
MLLAGAAGGFLVLVIGLAAMQLRVRPADGGAPQVQPPIPSSQPSASAGAASPQDCKVTRPIPAFVPPSGYLTTPPDRYGSSWFGSAALWTMIDKDGEVWRQSSLPHNPDGLTQKTFWWSVNWPSRAELEPAITVAGTRLDGPGMFIYEPPGTNAGADFGTAMLMGVDFPTPGCWQLTGRYRDAVLSYVVWITED